LIESPNWEEGIPTALSEIMDTLWTNKKEKLQFVKLNTKTEHRKTDR